jgi:hypothetical protein
MTAASLESGFSALIERRHKWPNRFFHTSEGFPQVRAAEPLPHSKAWLQV